MRHLILLAVACFSMVFVMPKAYACGILNAGALEVMLPQIKAACSVTRCSAVPDTIEMICEELTKIEKAMGQLDELGQIDPSLLGSKEVTGSELWLGGIHKVEFSEYQTMGNRVNQGLLEVMDMSADMTQFVESHGSGSQSEFTSGLAQKASALDVKSKQVAAETLDLSKKLTDVYERYCVYAGQGEWRCP